MKWFFTIYRGKYPHCIGLVTAILILSLPGPLYAVDGLSSGKLCMPWARTMSPGSVEFEPAVSLTTFDEVDLDGESVSLDGRWQVTTIDFRFTTGLIERLEMGVGFGIESANFYHDENPDLDESETSLADLGLGWKYQVWGKEEEAALAVEWGIGLPWVSQASYAVWEAGVIYSMPIGERWSVDADATGYFTSATSPGDPEVGATYNAGIAVDLTDKWTVATELNGFWERADDEEDTASWKITPTVGFAYGLNETVGVCVLAQQDVAGLGQNTELATVAQMLFGFAFE
ncbi:MAG: hypothetical protein JSU92_13805 [Deltaproteobacteria bacterium]|nr:MAG: hypothetical protein JSU92_13805 [Deltaproteobacteria bacterium]